MDSGGGPGFRHAIAGGAGPELGYIRELAPARQVGTITGVSDMAQKKAGPALLFQVPAMSAKRVEQLIERINGGQYGGPELANLYDNARERDVPAVMEAVELKMRADFPRAANRKFGAKEKASA
jgi:hypothetical protein